MHFRVPQEPPTLSMSEELFGVSAATLNQFISLYRPRIDDLRILYLKHWHPHGLANEGEMRQRKSVLPGISE